VSKAKKLHEFSEKEIIAAINQMPVFVAQWMKEVGIKYGSDLNEGYDIYEPVKKAILDEWLKAREIQKEISEK